MFGTIKNVQPTYGFLKDSDGTDRFFHAGEVKDVQLADLKGGDAVEFEPDTHPVKGARAKAVRPARRAGSGA